MKASELRIGNWVHHNDNWSHRNFSAPTNFQWTECDWYAVGECCMNLEDISPIPLTEEWLLKFGFENDVFKASGIMVNRYKIKGICLSIDTRKENEHKYLLFKDDKFIKTVKFIHELQNLYFALTGEELELKS